MNTGEISDNNIFLIDCDKNEIEDFLIGLSQVTKKNYEVFQCVCNSHKGFQELKRYFIYTFFPLKFIFFRKKYNYVIGWQQFFSLFYCFWSRIFHMEKCNIVVALNFTYKAKRGLKGKVYKKFMEYCLTSKYLDFIHVPSEQYVEVCCKEFGLKREMFLVSHFGILDMYSLWKNMQVEYERYSLAIGRSNRDFDWLVSAWKGLPKNELLIIASDTYTPQIALPENVIHRKDIVGDEQYRYIINAERVIIPIDDGRICSGDTVLLKSMSFEKTVVVTVPSTLGEMYINDGDDGVLIEKNESLFRAKIMELIEHPEKELEIGKRARQKYIQYYSRHNMGVHIGLELERSLL